LSPTVTLSGTHAISLVLVLRTWFERAGGQLFGSSTGFTMPDTAVLSPDAAWISAERINPFKRTTWSDGARPDGFPTDFTRVFDAGIV
jgi:Uma2 family endonuclease